MTTNTIRTSRPPDRLIALWVVAALVFIAFIVMLARAGNRRSYNYNSFPGVPATESTSPPRGEAY